MLRIILIKSRVKIYYSDLNSENIVNFPTSLKFSDTSVNIKTVLFHFWGKFDSQFGMSY